MLPRARLAFMRAFRDTPKLLLLLVLAVLHNWTPVGFLAEATRGIERRRWMLYCALLFALLPMWIASGSLHQILGTWGGQEA